MTNATPHPAADLGIARWMVDQGVPVWWARKHVQGKPVDGKPHRRWKSIAPDRAEVDAWNETLYLCATAGHGVDVVDIDPRNGGSEEAFRTLMAENGIAELEILARAQTRSGGTHLYLRTTGVHTYVADGEGALLGPGVDFKAGADGAHGMVFLPPSAREGGSYVWLDTFDPTVVLSRDPDTSEQAAVLRAILGRRDSKSSTRMTKPKDDAGPLEHFFADKEALARERAAEILEGHLATVAAYDPDSGGGFHPVINGAAFAIGGLVGGGYLTHDEATQLLIGSVEQIWLHADEDDLRRIEVGLTDGAERLPTWVVPKGGVDLTSAGGSGGGSGSGGRGAEQWLGDRPFFSTGTDRDVALQVLAYTQPVLRYAADVGQWLVRQDNRWALKKGDIAGWAVGVCSDFAPAGNKEGSEIEKAQFKARVRLRVSSSAGAIATAINRAVAGAGGSEPYAVQVADLDSEPWALWADGIQYDLRKCDRELAIISTNGQPHLRTARYRPDRSVDTPLWDWFTEAMWPDPELRNWALRVLSVGFTGESDRILPILHGPTGRGKTAIVSLLIDLLGDYGHPLNPAALTTSGDEVTQNWDLLGRRLSFIDEGPRGGSVARERLKRLTGGGRIEARPLYGQVAHFAASHTMVMSANEIPNISDPAILERARLIPCKGDPAAIKAARAMIGGVAEDQWQREAPGVLAKMMAEAAGYLDDRDSASMDRAPQYVRDEMAETEREQDTIAQWIREYCAPTGWNTASDLLRWHLEWLRNTNVARHEWPTATRFGRRLTELGVVKRRVERGSVYNLSIGGPGSWHVPPPEPVTSESANLSAEKFDRTNHPAGSLDGRSNAGSESQPAPHETPSPRGFMAGLASSFLSKSKKEEEEGKNEKFQENPVEKSFPQNDLPGLQGPDFPPSDPLVLDLETGPSELLHAPEADGQPFVRLTGFRQGPTPDGSIDQEQPEITLAETPDDLVRIIEQSDGPVVGHNVAAFDLPALRRHGLDLDALTASGRVMDTMLIAKQLDPPPAKRRGRSPTKYDLDSIGERMGLGGKFGEGGESALKKLARKHGGYDQIPTDDPTYRAYLERDVELGAAVFAALVSHPDFGRHADYLRREHRIAAITARMTANGFRIDPQLLAERLETVHGKRQAALSRLQEGLGVPVGPKAPLATLEGQERLVEAFQTLGVPDVKIPRTAKSGKLSTTAEAMAELAEAYPTVKMITDLVTEVTGSRSVYDTVNDHVIEHSSENLRVHPRISSEQSTGRWSVVEPGLTTVGKRDGRVVEREVFIPDEGELLISVDLAQVDARAVAALSGDAKYQEMFAPGRDLHAEVAERVWGDPSRREAAKSITHGWSYGMGIPSLAKNAGVEESVARQFDEEMQRQFPRLVQWRDEVRAHASTGALMDNGWGRMMKPDADRSWTQGPAFAGQSAARDIMAEGLLRLPAELLPMLRVVVHDEIVLSVPAGLAEDISRLVADRLSFEWRGVPILADAGTPGANWAAAYGK